MRFLFLKKGKRGEKKESGFTIIESLIAIVVLVFAVTGTFAAVQSALSTSIFAKNQVTAFFLAQEAVEYIINTRDTNILSGNGWLTGIADGSSACDFGKFCIVDATVNSNAFTSCSAPNPNNCPVLKQSTSGNTLYGYNPSWTDSQFKRYIQLQSVNSNEILATVNVSWTKGFLSKTITVKESIFNWQ